MQQQGIPTQRPFGHSPQFTCTAWRKQQQHSHSTRKSQARECNPVTTQHICAVLAGARLRCTPYSTAYSGCSASCSYLHQLQFILCNQKQEDIHYRKSIEAARERQYILCSLCSNRNASRKYLCSFMDSRTVTFAPREREGGNTPQSLIGTTTVHWSSETGLGHHSVLMGARLAQVLPAHSPEGIKEGKRLSV